MKILLTGGNGFLGSHVLHLLIRKGYQVRATRRANSRMDWVDNLIGVEWVEMDITDPALEAVFEDITHVVHCAAMVSFHPRDHKRMQLVNVEGTANLVNLSLDLGVKKFVHTSSIAALGRSKERTHMDETAKWETSKHNTQYAISKYLAEQEVWRAQAEGLKVAIANPSMIIGPGHWDENTARFFRQIHNGMPFCPIGSTGFVDVRDVAEFLVFLLESDIADKRFVVTGHNLSYREFFDKIAAAMGVKPPGIKVQPWLAEIAWRVEWLREKILGSKPVVTKESARTSTFSYSYGNHASLKAYPGFKYRPIEQTIRETAQAYLASIAS